MNTDIAICLRCWDWSETSQTVSLLTRSHGIIRGIAKGSKRDNGVFSGGFNPVTQGQIVYRLKNGADLATLTEWQLEHVWWKVRSSLEVNKAAIYMVDLVNRMMTSQDPHPVVFDALVESLNRMNQGHEINWSLLRFSWALLVDTGYQPSLEGPQGLAKVVGFSADAGGIVADTGGIDRVRVRRETIEVLKLLLEEQPMSTIEPETLQRANRLLAHYFRHIIGKEPAAMRWMWGTIQS